MDVTPGSHSTRRLHVAARDAALNLPPELPPVLVFTDPVRSAPPLVLAQHIPPGWGLVFRHFGAPDRVQIATQIAELARIRRFALLIGADPDLAWRVKSDGVHWPEALRREAIRSAGSFRLNTMSAHRPNAALGPQPPGIDARILSTVFLSASPSAGPAMGATRFRALASRARIPIYGLGGVNPTTAGSMSNFGGLAGVGQLTD